MRWRRLCTLATAAALAAAGIGVAGIGTAAAAPAGTLVSENPVDFTPQIQDGAVNSIVQVGDTIYLGGSFTQVKEAGANKPVVNRARVLAFDATTGTLDTTFDPVVDKGEVDVVLPSADGESLYIGGSFSAVDGQTHRKLAKIDAATGQPDAAFQADVNAKVRDLRLIDGRLYVGGNFTHVSGVAQAGITTLNPSTGARDAFFDLPVTGTQNGGVTAVIKMDVTPDGSRLVGVGNFTTVAGQSRPQIFMVDLTGSQARLANWQTARYAAECSASFDTYMRDVDFAPDGSFFVVTTTGGHRGVEKMCDTHARWENVANGSGKQPTWTNWTGGDTSYAVEVTGEAVYVGGHFRWANNPYASDKAGEGAVAREGIAALDPLTGLPFTWNPGRARGVGVFDILATGQGVWIGSDTDMAGGETHQKVAMFPAAGGTALPVLEPGELPGEVYRAGGIGLGAQNYLKHRSFDGATAGPEQNGSTAGVDWRYARGAFMLSGRLYYGGSDGGFYSRTFDGTTLGAQTAIDTADRLVPMTTWHSQVRTIQGMFYSDGKVYYTRGDAALHYRHFTPESGVVGAVEYTATNNLAAVDWRTVGGMFVSGGKLYYVDNNDGNLRALTFGAGVPSGSPVLVDDGDWRGRTVFLHAAEPNGAPSAAFTRTCTGLDCGFDGSASTDADGTVESLAWNFGDGETGTGVTPEHTYTEAGEYTVKLTVTDNRGGTDTTQQTVTVAEDQVPVSFRGTAGFNENASNATVTVPSGVQAGDAMLLFATMNTDSSDITPPAGWTEVGTQTNNNSRSTVWQKVAAAGDAGSDVTVGLAEIGKVSLRLAAYAGTAASPVAASAKAADSATEHKTPQVAVAEPGSWVVSYWSDKSSSTTAWTPPSSGEQRAVSIGSGGGRVTSLLVDSGGAVATGDHGPLTATTNASSRGLMWTVVLRPAA
ncbi:PKD domain-containing protein [Actinomadura algeriensis]|uniref:PKD repeat protein n=1 Tax=Actinomadura algeriensis TaxID=1679523 RepID=A0ABR9JU39_9ACTN|nr:PKD domain-containing protein [Actinomadura algeriensis]MBE1534080.1 PKD repeat protein [Actinomadura algeriensis]